MRFPVFCDFYSFSKKLNYSWIDFCFYLQRSKLRHNSAFVQIPIGLEGESKGVVDIIEQKALYFEGAHGQNVVEKPIPNNLKSIAEEKLVELIGNNKSTFFSLNSGWN